MLLQHEVPVLDGHLNLFVLFGFLAENMCHPITRTGWINGVNSQDSLSQTDKAERILSVLEVKSQQQKSKILQFSFDDNKQLFPSRPKKHLTEAQLRKCENTERELYQSGLVKRLMNSTAKGNQILLLIFCVSDF